MDLTLQGPYKPKVSHGVVSKMSDVSPRPTKRTNVCPAAPCKPPVYRTKITPSVRVCRKLDFTNPPVQDWFKDHLVVQSKHRERYLSDKEEPVSSPPLSPTCLQIITQSCGDKLDHTL